MRIKQRKILFTDIVPFPASKTAGELTILGDELNSFELNPGEARIQLVAEDKSKIVNNLSVNLQVSYDKGENWVKVVSYDDLSNGSGAVSELKEGVISFAPRVRLNGVFDSSGALLENHGCKVYAELKEGDFSRNFVTLDAVNMPNSVSTNDVPAVKSTVNFTVPSGFGGAGNTVVISNGTIDETYDGAAASILAPDVNTNSDLVTATQSGGVITVTADTAGAAGNLISVTLNEIGESPIVYELLGGSDLVDTPELVVEGDLVNPEVENINKVLVVTSCDSTKTNEVVSYNVQTSFDGKAWWGLSPTSIDLDKDFIETEFTSKLGNQFRIVATVAESKALVENHNTKFNLVIFYI